MTVRTGNPPSESALFWTAISKSFVYSLLVCLGVIVLYPLLWMAASGFKTNTQIFNAPFAMPLSWSLENYIGAWNEGVRSFLVSSLIVTATSAFCTVMISAWTAYGLTRTRMPGKPLITAFILGGLMLSPTVALIPLVRMMQSVGLYNTHWALILLYTAFRIPFGAGPVQMGVRPEDLALAGDAAPLFRGRIDHIEHLGELQLVHTDVGIADKPVIAKLPGDLDLRRGADIALAARSSSIHVFDTDGRRLNGAGQT